MNTTAITLSLTYLISSIFSSCSTLTIAPIPLTLLLHSCHHSLDIILPIPNILVVYSLHLTCKRHTSAIIFMSSSNASLFPVGLPNALICSHVILLAMLVFFSMRVCSVLCKVGRDRLPQTSAYLVPQYLSATRIVGVRCFASLMPFLLTITFCTPMVVTEPCYWLTGQECHIL